MIPTSLNTQLLNDNVFVKTWRVAKYLRHGLLLRSSDLGPKLRHGGAAKY